MVTLVFDEGHYKLLLRELFDLLKAFDSLESVPEHIRAVLKECFAGRGFEFSYTDDGTALPTGERLIKVHIGGKLLDALSALRAM